MAWIRWRETQGGVRLAALQWRDAEGKVQSKALRTSDERLAEMHLEALRRRLGESPGARPREVSPQGAVQDFLKEKSISARPATVAQYRRRLDLLLREWKDVPLPEWNRRRFVAFLERRRWGPRSIQLMAFVCRNFIRWAQQSGVPIPDFVQGFRAPALHQSEPRHLEAGELRRLLEAVRDRPLETAVALCSLAGLRLAEMKIATWADVDWTKDEILVHGLKTHADRTVPMSRELRAILWRHRAAAGFVYAGGRASVERNLGAACRRARIPRVSWHPLRHTFATRMLAAGTDLATVQNLLGHRTPYMTLRYCHASSARKKAAVERLGRSVGSAG